MSKVSPWKLSYNYFDPEKENLREALCTLGNGYLGTRGAVPETNADRVHYPGTYIAGVYNALMTPIAGREIINEDFVNCPNWLMFNYRIDGGPWFNRLRVKILSWKMELNMRKGILSRRIRWKDDQGRITLVESHRIVSMADPHVCAMRFSITPENYNGRITLRSGIDGLVVNAGVERYKQLNHKHLQPYAHGSFEEDGVFLTMETNQSRIRITEAQRTRVLNGHNVIRPEMNVLLHGRERIMQQFSLDIKEGERYSVEKLVGIYTSRDHGVADPCALAQEKAASIESFDAAFKPHQARWKALWRVFDIQVDGDHSLQQILRLHAFHLLQSASTYNEDIDAGLPARGLHGEAYRGHIFWDEMYAYPFYNLHAPEVTRALLMYRYRRLDAAKENARNSGYRGAMFPWQSASTGEETSQVIHLNPMSGTWGPDYSALQRHVSIAIAYNVWTYYYTSGDRDFLERHGIEMFLEIAHFWSSATTFNTETGRYEIKGVMGPDEFHEKYPGAKKGGLDNNAYTNVMAVWVIEKALHFLDQISDEDRTAILYKSQISEDEIARWQDITHKMTVPMDESGLIHQYQGYMDLKELDWDEYRKKYDNIHRIDRILKAEGESPDSYKASKQADTLMLFYVLNYKELKKVFTQLGYDFDREVLKKNYDYYIQRTSHGSTLSRVVHAYIAQRLGYYEEAERYFYLAAESDINDTQGGTTQEGIHVGVMAGTVDVMLRSFAGLAILEDQICLNPELPAKWRKLKFRVRYKNIWFSLVLTQDKVSVCAKPISDVSLQQSGKIPIQIKGKKHQLSPGKYVKIDL
ncbi:MAG: glycoside hydrolase family 65 protein [Candidatus Omnitrophota bacterium]